MLRPKRNAGVPSPQPEVGRFDRAASTKPEAARASGTAVDRMRDDAVSGSLWTAIQAGVTLPFAIVANLIVARTLGPSDYGQLATYMTMFGIISLVLNAGVNDATMQWGAAAYAQGRIDDLRSIAAKCAGYHVCVQAPCSAIATIAILRHSSAASIFLAALGVTISLSVNAIATVLTAIAKNALLARLNLAAGIVTQVAVAVCALLSHDPVTVWVCRLFAGALLPLLALVAAPGEYRQAIMRPQLPRSWPGGFSRYGWKSAFANLIGTLVFSRSELIILNADGFVFEAGLFALAAGLASQITAPVDAALGPLVPASAGIVAISKERASRAFARALRLSCFASSCLAVIAIPSVSMLTGPIYGRSYIDSSMMFVALGIVSCLQSALNPVTAFVIAMRCPGRVLLINSTGVVLDLLLVLALVHVWPIGAAVVGSAASQLVSLTGTAVLLKRRLDLTFSAFARALRPFAACSFVTALGSCLGVWLGGESLWSSIVLIPTVLTLAFACLIIIYRNSADSLFDSDLVVLTRVIPRTGRYVARTATILRVAHEVEIGETVGMSGCPHAHPSTREVQGLAAPRHRHGDSED